MDDPGPADRPLLHITTDAAWSTTTDTGASHHTDPSLDGEGFIHCSTPAQVLIPANERFAGQTDLVLLIIDEHLLDADLVFEDCYETGLEFPHVYGPIARNAVVEVVPFPPLDDGTFELPARVVELQTTRPTR